jgi:hypothetical protein
MGARILRRAAAGNLDAAKKWRRRRFTVTLLEILSYLGAMALGVVLVWSLVIMIAGPGILTGLNDRCGRYSAACGAEVGFLIPILSVALASAVFLFYRLRRVTSPVVKRARSDPQRLVETATPDIKEVVGRNELCRVIMEDVRHLDTRRPHLLVGGVGTGKTAVLVQLTRLFAQHHAVPVPIRLRDAQERLNFREMAHTRFLAMAEGSLLSADDAEKVWRQLSRDDKIVVIADGLEEALVGESVRQDRDNMIRLAIHRARELGMPLIITSRPHDPLRGADATIMELEPLNEEAALKYITKDDDGGGGGGARWLDWIVETAGLAELPLYLQLTRQLWRHDQLDYLSAEWSAEKMDLRNMDRSRLRFYLLDRWMQSLYAGHLIETVPLNSDERKAAVQWLSALACIGLKDDTIDVKIDSYYQAGSPALAETDPKPRYRHIDEAIRAYIGRLDKVRTLDLKLAVTWAAQLQLVEAHPDGLRFRHSIMEAYLGSCFLPIALEDDEFRRGIKARLQRPGRELLIALVLYSRSPGAIVSHAPGPGADARKAVFTAAATAGTAPEDRGPGPSAPHGQIPAGPGRASSAPEQDGNGPELHNDVGSIRDVLYWAADRSLDPVKQLDLYAATLEIDSFLKQTRHREIALSLASCWNGFRDGDQRTLEEAKRGLVCRFGDATRTISKRNLNPGTSYPAYRELFDIGRREKSYPIRLAIAQEIGAGGDDAFRLLRGLPDGSADNVWKKTAWPDVESSSSLNGDGPERDGHRLMPGRTLCAWLTPLLVGSVRDCGPAARQELEQWLNHVGNERPVDANRLDLSLEVALAQGFKYAANRRFRHPHAQPETRFYLAEQAMEMLEKARFWFSQLTLIHALCLWEIPDPGVTRDGRPVNHHNAADTAKGRGRRPGSDPEAIVGRWLEVARNKDHPFVREAAKLAAQALRTGRPERFLWIDESGVVSSVGSRAAPGNSYRKHHLWIPPSSGWATLDPRARQLVGDVLILLNLAERGAEPGEIEQRLRRANRNDLPPCLSRDRDSLGAHRTTGGPYAAPGNNCTDGCLFRLCPYPSRGAQPYRSELSEAFCRGQQTLLRRGMTAPWQASRRADLKRFWAEMANRARGATGHNLD